MRFLAMVACIALLAFPVQAATINPSASTAGPCDRYWFLKGVCEWTRGTGSTTVYSNEYIEGNTTVYNNLTVSEDFNATSGNTTIYNLIASNTTIFGDTIVYSQMNQTPNMTANMTAGPTGPAGPQGEPGDPGTTDHGLLTGLADDDHLQYVNILGRPGGQNITGNIGINIVPVYPLDVYSPTSPLITRLSTKYSDGGYLLLRDEYNRVNAGFFGYGKTLFSLMDNATVGFRSQGGFAMATGGGYTAMYIDPNRNVGFGSSIIGTNLTGSKVYINASNGYTGFGTTAPEAVIQIGTNSVAMPSDTGEFITGPKSLRFGSSDGNTNDGGYVKPSYVSGGRLTIGARTGGVDQSGIALTANGNTLVAGTVDTTNAVLNVNSTTKAFLPPRMTTAQRNAIVGAVAGMQVYTTDGAKSISFHNGTGWCNVSWT